jgi:succinate dehydrogenase / fumarate reductase, flavoprotein subunit
VIEAKATLLAAGGFGQVYRTTSNAHINTGDGCAMALRAGVPVMDMKFFQFQPTGIAGKGMLITEGVRGEGGYLINRDGERFMERYAPRAKDLASRDVVARAIVTEVKEGRGCGEDGDHVLLKLDHLGEAIISKRLPGIRESSRIFAGVDPFSGPGPVFPTADDAMGGIPTDRHGRVVAPVRKWGQTTFSLARGEHANRKTWSVPEVSPKLKSNKQWDGRYFSGGVAHAWGVVVPGKQPNPPGTAPCTRSRSYNDA